MKQSTFTLLKALVVLLALCYSHQKVQAQCPNAILNGNFENGLTDWFSSNNTVVAPNVAITTDALEGSSSVQVGNYDLYSFPWSEYIYLYQNFQVPLQGGILSFDYECTAGGYASASTQMAYIGAPAYLGNQIYDTLLFKVWDSSSGTVSFNMAPYAGRTVSLRFRIRRETNAAPENSSNYTTAGIKVDRVVLNTKTSIQRFDECQLGFSHAVGNHVYTNYGTYYDTIPGNGCDSIITTYVTKKYSRVNQFIYYCPGSPISSTVGNQTYTAAGTYVDTLLYPANCDSILSTTIAYYPDPSLNRALVGCDGLTFNSGNIIHTVSGTGVHNYLDTLYGASKYGCDSVIRTEVTIYNTPATAAQIANRVLCNGQTSSKIAFNLPDNTTFTKWHSSNPNIGLNAMGVDTIPQFVAINNGTTPIIDTITVVVKGRGIAWIPSGNMMYKYDLSTKAVTDSAIIPGGKLVQDIAFNHSGSTVYAASVYTNYGNNQYTRKIYAFSASTGEFLREYLIMGEGSTSTRPLETNMCVSPDDQYLYISACSRNSGQWQFEKVDLATGVVTQYDSYPNNENEYLHGHMCFSPDKSKVYIGAMTGSGRIIEFNMPDFTYSRTISVPIRAYAMICSPDGKRLFVGHGIPTYSPVISVVDLTADTVITNLMPSLFSSYGVEGAFSYTPDSTRLIVCFSNQEKVLTGPNASRFYSYDINTYQLAAMGGQYGYLPNYDTYFGAYLSFHNGFVTPDGRDMMIHEPNIINNGYFGMIYKKIGATGGFTNAGTSLRTDDANKSGSMGDLFDAGHCESQVMTFTITINPTKYTNQVTICNGDTFNVGNKRYTTSGTYVDTLQGVSIYGCDSIVTTQLTVTPYATSYQAFNFCGSGSITVGNVTHTTTGYYSDTLQAAASDGCDSIVFTNLIINPMPAAPNVTVSNQSACPGATIAATNLGNGSNGNSIVWNGTTTSIGLAATGATTVPAFTALNSTNNAITDTISVTTTATGYAYVANPNFASLAVINRQTNAVVNTISNLNGASGVAVSPNGSRVYVTGQNVNSLFVLNAATNTLANTIAVGTQPFNVAVNPAGNRLYVANNGSNNVSVVDTVTNTVIATIPVKTNPRGLAVHPDGKRLYVTNSGSDTVSVISTITNTVVASIAVGDNPFALAINAAGNRAYVANLISGTVSVINTESNTLITNISVGSTARGLALTPDGTTLYVTDFLNNKVYVVNTATNTVTTTITVSNRPTGVSVSADGTKAYVTNSTGPTVSVISTATNTVVATVNGLSGPDTQGNFVSGSGCSSTPVKYTITVYPKPQYTQQIALCTGNSITVGIHTYNTTGVYRDTLPNASVNGCDSIVTTQLIIHSPVTTTVNATICQGSNYAGHTTSGTYVDHYNTVYGCDSTRTLNLTVNPTVATTVALAICQGSSYAGHTTSGTYIDHYTAVNGCDSARTLNLTVNPNVTSTVNVAICQGSSYAGHNASGTYVDHYTSATGCDSTRTLNLVINQPSTSTTNIAICQSQLPYSWNGLTFNTAGTQTKTGFVNTLGCDSSATLNLTVNESINSVTNISVCRAALPYSWNGLLFTDAGSQTATGFTSISGCDSTATLNLTVNDTSHEYFNYSICESAMPLSWNSITITAPGTYTKTGFTNMYGCDSSITMYFTTRPSTNSTTNMVICQNQLPYLWNGLTFTTSGSQTKTGLTNSVNCDSSATLNLTVIPAVSVTNISICQSQLPYTWNGLTFNTAGIQTKTGFVNILGCDSSATLNLTVNESINSVTSISVCRAALPYSWNGLLFTDAGSQTATGFTSISGCDSTATLNLTVNDTSHEYFNYSICESAMPLSWNSITITAPGTYTKTGFTNMYGCDSSITMYFTTRPSTSSTTNMVICQNQLPYLWNGLTFTTSGSQTKTGLTNSVNCDSSATLNLTVIPAISVTNISICQSQLPYSWNGLTFNTAGTQTATGFTNINGCDSSASLVLTVNTTASSTTSITSCGSYTWNDNTYTTSGIYSKYFANGAANGCDSTAHLVLTINNSSTGTNIVSACSSYTWIDGNTYTTSNNTATYTLTGSNGCDSVVTLNLTINNPTAGIDVQTACGSYTWLDGNTYTTSNNTATYTLTGSNGCDSVITLNLTINNPTTGSDVQIACGSYTWLDGNTYTTSNNTATYTLTGSNGCDSVVTLNLTINNPTTGTDVQTACGSYTWLDGNTYTTSNNTVTYTLTGSNGCDSVVTLNLTINNPTTGTDVQTACGSYTWLDGNTYTTSNNTATYILTGSNGCDSVVTLNLTINNPATGTDVQTACGSYTWLDGNTYTTSNNTATYTLTGSNGCDSVVTLNLQITEISKQVTVTGANCSATESSATYQWIDCNTNILLAGATLQTFTATQNGSYACIIEKNDCIDTTDCVMVNGLSVTDLKNYTFELYPNPSAGVLTISFNYPGNCNMRVMDVLGQVVFAADLTSSINIFDVRSLIAGVYQVSIWSNNQKLSVKPFVKQ